MAGNLFPDKFQTMHTAAGYPDRESKTRPSQGSHNNVNQLRRKITPPI